MTSVSAANDCPRDSRCDHRDLAIRSLTQEVLRVETERDSYRLLLQLSLSQQHQLRRRVAQLESLRRVTAEAA